MLHDQACNIRNALERRRHNRPRINLDDHNARVPYPPMRHMEAEIVREEYWRVDLIAMQQQGQRRYAIRWLGVRGRDVCRTDEALEFVLGPRLK